MENIQQYAKWAYVSINARLRNGNAPDQQALALSAELAQLKPVNGTFYRSIEVDADAYVRSLKGKNQITFPSFLSTSKKERVADLFGNVKFIINGKSGRDISKIVHFDTEAEVLFDMGTTFRIDSVTKLGNAAIIQLTEL